MRPIDAEFVTVPRGHAPVADAFGSVGLPVGRAELGYAVDTKP